MPDIHPSLVSNATVSEEIKRNELSLARLPPIADIVLPVFTTKSGTIRWLFSVGYPVKEIAFFLGIKYQMVRNIVTTVPKRAAREDMALLEVKIKETPDLLEAALDGALDASLMEGRKERNKKRLADLRSGDHPDAEVVELPAKSSIDRLNRV